MAKEDITPIPNKDTVVAKAGITPIPKKKDQPEKVKINHHAYPTEDKRTGGVWEENSTGEYYALAIHEENPYGYTHYAINEVHMHHMTAKDFAERFTARQVG